MNIKFKKKTPTYNMTLEQLNQMKQKAEDKGAETGFILMLALPTIVINDKLDKIVASENPCETFVNECLEQYECFTKGLVSIDDLKKLLLEETGVKIEYTKGL